ncbi:uncharacterized protein TNCV_1868111 [Trichonephila clavipes]|nr:uncharacterized protein TNCV_1868111 [Trichonephila clavipes]
MALPREYVQVVEWFIEFKSVMHAYAQSCTFWDVRKILDVKTSPSDGWVRNVQIFWSPRSHDITLMDFLQGYVKNILHQSPIPNSELKSRITATVQIVDPGMLHRRWLEIVYRLGVVHATTGAHIEIRQ